MGIMVKPSIYMLGFFMQKKAGIKIPAVMTIYINACL